MQKPGYFILITGLLCLAGCSKKEEGPDAKATNAAASSGNPLTAPVDYLGAVSKAQKMSVKTIDTAYITQAISLFNASEGRFPRDLDELVTEKYLGKLDPPYGMKFQYNPTTGQIRVVPK